MAAPHNSSAVSQDTLITIKISVNDSLKKLKLPLRDLGANSLPDKLRHVLDIRPEQHVILERYSDSVGGYITLDEKNPQVFKTLIRAAKAKLKLRLKATVTPADIAEKAAEKEVAKEETSALQMAEAAAAPRDSTALDQRSIGSGIFQFKEARASQQTLVNDEAPVPRPFNADRSDFLSGLAAPSLMPSQPSLAFRLREPGAHSAASPQEWTVYCNMCKKAMENEHYHCSICDGGDFDLCQECVNSDVHCPGEGHWLIKRFIQNGKVIKSTTERVSPRKVGAVQVSEKPEPVAEKEMPGAFTDETKTLTEEARTPTRTCNCCVIVLAEREFVTCTTCDDFDLCIKCHTENEHGHHPAHGFKPATVETVLPIAAQSKLAPGRNVRHNAICDGCDKNIYGVRHKCLNCPDWDYCGECIKGAGQTHPRHRFAPLYQPIAEQCSPTVRHLGIYCDGPLCSNKPEQSYIQGVRYKCTICHDADFCASCEALPGNNHNRTHPLIKLKTPVRNVNVSTENEDVRGNVRVMGDRRSSPVMPTVTKSASTETIPVPQANAATQVQTVAEFTPTEIKKEETKPIPIPVKKFEEKQAFPIGAPSATIPMALLNAHFVRDSIPDGMNVVPEQLFTQIWTLKNPGPYVWPAGCSVRYVGGDNMLNVDNSHPNSVTSLADATESNVVGREVQIGEEVAFKVVLKAPVREGKSISYWRLKASDGTPFGHRLWCDIEVKKSEMPHFVPPAAFAAAPSAQRAPLPQHSGVVPNQEQQLALQRIRIQQMQMARQAAHQKNLERMAFAAQQGQQSTPYSPARSAPPAGAATEQPPAYDNMNLSARLAAMREQQKQRRELMLAQLNQQRDQQQTPGTKREDMPNSLQQINPYPANKAGEATGDKERREALKQRVAHIKANILKTREEREKTAEAISKQNAAATTAAAVKKSNEETEKVKRIVAEVAKQADEDEAGEELDGSQMVFPKLDKESPASSTYQSATSSSSKGKAAYVENEAGEVERSATPTAAPQQALASPVDEDFVELDDELEVLSANEDESDDDGFLTDEEYDILDASDQETVADM